MMDITLLPDDTAIVSEGGKSITINLAGRTIDDALSDVYYVVLREIGTSTRYTFVNPSTLETSYRPTWQGAPISEILSFESEFPHTELSKTHVIHAVMRDCDGTREWMLSYMPSKRTRISKPTRLETYAKCGGRCAYCGKFIDISEMQVDHVVSHYRHRGEDTIDNYLPACRDCNGLKSDYTLEEFRDVLIPSCANAKIGANTRQSRIRKAYGLNPKFAKRIVFYFEKEKK